MVTRGVRVGKLGECWQNWWCGMTGKVVQVVGKMRMGR